MAHQQPQQISSGIDELVDKLKADGIQAGQQQAREIIAEAQKKADLLEQQAKEKADTLLNESHERITRENQAAKEALQLAFRDMVLEMKNDMLERLSANFSHQVRQQASATPLLEKIIIEAVRQISSDIRLSSPVTEPKTQATEVKSDVDENIEADIEITETGVEILVPQQMMQLDDIRANPEKASDGPLAELASQLTGQMFSQGISFVAGEQQAGIQMKLQQGNMVVDLTDKAIADLLLKYLQPRFRAILEGVIH